MTITHIAALSAASAPAMASAQTSGSHEAQQQFDAMLYRLMLQNVDLAAGFTGGKKAEMGIFREMITDMLAQEAARQQMGFGALVMNISNANEGENK